MYFLIFHTSKASLQKKNKTAIDTFRKNNLHDDDALNQYLNGMYTNEFEASEVSHVYKNKAEKDLKRAAKEQNIPIYTKPIRNMLDLQ